MNWEHVVAFVVISVSMLLSMHMAYLQGKLHGVRECRAIVEKHFAERKEEK